MGQRGTDSLWIALHCFCISMHCFAWFCIAVLCLHWDVLLFTASLDFVLFCFACNCFALCDSSLHRFALIHIHIALQVWKMFWALRAPKALFYSPERQSKFSQLNSEHQNHWWNLGICTQGTRPKVRRTRTHPGMHSMKKENVFCSGLAFREEPMSPPVAFEMCKKPFRQA